MTANWTRNLSCLPVVALCGALALLTPGAAVGTDLGACEREIEQLRDVSATCQSHPGCAAIASSLQTCEQSAQFLDHLRVGLNGRRVVRAHDVFDAHAPPLAPNAQIASYVRRARHEAVVQERLGQRTLSTMRDGVAYEGAFSTDLTGFGVALGDDGFMARGHFVNGVLSGGVGQLVTPSREVISGEFSDGLLDGEGAVQDTDRIVTAGTFERNLIVGAFSRTYPDGRVEHVAAGPDRAPMDGAVLRRAPSEATADAQRAIDRSIAWERDRPAREAAEQAARASARAAVEAEIAEIRRRDREGAARIWGATRVALGVVAETYAARERERLEQERQQQARLEQQRQQAALAARQAQSAPPQTYTQHTDNSGGTSFEGQTTSPPEPAGQRIYDTAEEYAAATGNLNTGGANGGGQRRYVNAAGQPCVTMVARRRGRSIPYYYEQEVFFANTCDNDISIEFFETRQMGRPEYRRTGLVRARSQDRFSCLEHKEPSAMSSGCAGFSASFQMIVR